MNNPNANCIRIMSVNCRGLADEKKRRDVFHYIRQKAYSIYLLQDTHFDAKIENYVRAEWGYKAYFASNTSVSRGVAILFNNNFEFEVKKIYKEAHGNYIIVHINTLDTDIILISVYGPNRDDPLFYEELEKYIKDINCNNIIIGGDWNLIMDFSIDCYNYKKLNNEKAQDQVINMADNLNLIDIWREMNPDKRRYTWRKNNPFQQSRLDFFLISDSLISFVTDTDIIPGYKTDHSIINIVLQFGKQIKRNTFWKFNSSLLKEKNFVDNINDVINIVIEEYAATPYDRENLKSIPKGELCFTVSDQLLLETLLMKIRTKTISYSVFKKQEQDKLEHKLEQRIEKLEKNLLTSEDNDLELRDCKDKLEKIREKKMEGVLLRSRSRWVAEGEKVTKYFCNLEKRNYVNKTFYRLKRTDGSEIDNQSDIIEEVTKFYENLYEKKDLDTFNFEEKGLEIKRLSDEESESLEGEISLEEASRALKNMKNGKSPGTDGFTVEFFKVFWKHLGPLVVRSLNEGFRKGELSVTQREGIITCIPKTDKPRDNIKNWRPITLLNIIYKIGTTCIANRIKPMMPGIIEEDQTGFIQGRFLRDNIRLIYDIISYVNNKNIPGLLLSLDFEKAFDSLDWDFMLKVLHEFGFRDSICRWIKTFYKDAKACVLVNGQASRWFPIKRGCRQGDPISPYIFIFCAEILATMIRQNEQIKGINIQNTEFKLSQYADDTEVFLNGEKSSFEATINTINEFGNFSGLLLNSEKTTAVWIGCRRNSNIRYMQHLNMKWNPENFKILGVWFTNDLKEIIDLNIQGKLAEIKILYRIWISRQLTPLGRIAVLKSLILSKLTHLWIFLPNPPESTINKIQENIFQFVWNNKRDRICRKTATKRVSQGGLGIPDIQKHIISLKLSWVRNLCFGSSKWRHIIGSVYPDLLQLDKFGNNVPINKYNFNDFWSDVLKSYNFFSKQVDVQNQTDILAERLFYNDNIKLDNNVLFIRSWFNKGVTSIANLLNENGTFLSQREFIEKYNVQTNFLTYAGIILIIKEFLKLKNVTPIDNRDATMSRNWQIIYSTCKGAQTFYEIIKDNDVQPNCCNSWNSKFSENIIWQKVFKNVQYIREIKFKWFQIRLVNRILATNDVLLHMKVRSNNLCSFCSTERENIQHLFWNCDVVKNFWACLELNVNKCNQEINVKLTELFILFGYNQNCKSDRAFDYIVLLAKYFIYTNRCKNTIPNYNLFLKFLKRKYEIERHIANINLHLDSFNRVWTPYILLFEAA